MQILAKTVVDQVITLWVEASDTIVNVKAMPPMSSSRFSGSSWLMAAHLRLQHSEGAHIALVLRLRGGMQSFAKKVAGKTTTLDVAVPDTIVTVKAMIGARSHSPRSVALGFRWLAAGRWRVGLCENSRWQDHHFRCRHIFESIGNYSLQPWMNSMARYLCLSKLDFRLDDEVLYISF